MGIRTKFVVLLWGEGGRAQFGEHETGAFERVHDFIVILWIGRQHTSADARFRPVCPSTGRGDGDGGRATHQMTLHLADLNLDGSQRLAEEFSLFDDGCRRCRRRRGHRVER